MRCSSVLTVAGKLRVQREHLTGLLVFTHRSSVSGLASSGSYGRAHAVSEVEVRTSVEVDVAS